MSGTSAGVSLECPTDISTECWKVPGYRYVSYDNSAQTPCGTSRIDGTIAGVCSTPNVRVSSWLINGQNVIADPTADGWDNCAVGWLNDFATTLNLWDPFAGNWSVVQSEACAYFVRSRALPAIGVQYGRLTATNIDNGNVLTFDPVAVSRADTYYRRIVTALCDGSTIERWVDANGAVVTPPALNTMIPCTADIIPNAQRMPTQRLRPRVQRLTGTTATADFQDGNNVQTLTLRVITGPVRIRAAGGGSPVTYADDYTVPSGTVLTWGVTNDAHAQLDGALIFNGTAAASDFIVNWTETLHTDAD
ncbi:hypothetical protein [Streptomyces olivochromogenes]|uniref:hypothetical protein n=1 Tax=Streptomyces olivochromogenes TaxID=1963 RepID=UPI0036855531